jgi:magnesium-transporting ATPase (P-type)
MARKSYLPPFGKIFTTSLMLSILGLGGLAFILITLEPTLWPRWLFYFFLTMAGTGVALPAAYIIQRRLAKQYVPAKVLIREGLLFGIYLDLLAWLQIGRIASNLVIFLLAGGMILLEIFLRMAEKATFRADEYSDE